MAEGNRSGIGTVGRVLALGAIIFAAVVVAFILFSADGGYQVTARFENAAQLVPGNEVYVGGARAGSVKDIQITPDGQADVKVQMLDKYAPLRQGTRAIIKQTSLSGIANRYVDVEIGGGTNQAIESGGRIGPESTETAVELDELFNLFDPVARVAVQDFFEGSDKMIRGKGQELQRGIKYLNPTLSTSRRLFKELTRDERLLARFLIDSGRLTNTLSDRSTELTGLVRNLNGTFTALASQKGALAESIDRLPPFMRRANTTFVNLRAALDDVDPLVDASKPVARRLQPFFRELRGLAREGVPTVRDLSRTIRRRGRSNDLIELVNSFPPLASTALDTKTINGARRRGAFPESAQAMRRFQPTAAIGRPYTNDLVGWFDDFSATGAYDALGGFSRAGIYFDEILATAGGILPSDDGPPVQGSFKKCPGAGEVKLPDRTNVPTAEEQAFLDCTEADRPFAGGGE
ncbi:MAG TPA: MlaD family protein [Thermoleophilaceae bacterium]|nr:MlaD family protein [Thermoleophilaceae bacterium]